MALMSPILRLRRAFRLMGAEPEAADEVVDSIDEHTYSRRESDLRHAQTMADFHRAMAELRTQILIGIMAATGLLLAALGVAVAIILSVLD